MFSGSHFGLPERGMAGKWARRPRRRQALPGLAAIHREKATTNPMVMVESGAFGLQPDDDARDEQNIFA